jgi:hypothetical protein
MLVTTVYWSLYEGLLVPYLIFIFIAILEISPGDYSHSSG